MAILAGLLGFVGRFAGKLLTTTLGWASTLLFGREILYRERLQVERDLLAGSRPGASFPGGGPRTLAPDGNGRRPQADALPDWLPAAIAAGGFVLTAADVALALAERLRRRG